MISALTRASPLFLPVVGVATVAVIALVLWGSRRDIDRPLWLGAAVWSTILVAASALLPTANDVARNCSFRVSLPPVGALLSLNQDSLNILLTIPLGATIAHASSRRRGTAMLIALALPLIIEFVQWLVPALGRACQLGDVILNAIGLAFGFTAGTLISWLRQRTLEV